MDVNSLLIYSEFLTISNMPKIHLRPSVLITRISSSGCVKYSHKHGNYYDLLLVIDAVNAVQFKVQATVSICMRNVIDLLLSIRQDDVFSQRNIIRYG